MGRSSENIQLEVFYKAFMDGTGKSKTKMHMESPNPYDRHNASSY